MDTNKRKLIRLAIQQRCKPEDNYYLYWHWRIWFTLKAVLCILFDAPPLNRDDDRIDVAAFNGRYYWSEDCYNAYAWETLIVAYKGWRYAISSDGNC